MKGYRFPYADLMAHARREKAKRLALEAGTPPRGPSPERGSVQMAARCSACEGFLFRRGFRGPWLHTNTLLTLCQDQPKEDRT